MFQNISGGDLNIPRSGITGSLNLSKNSYLIEPTER